MGWVRLIGCRCRASAIDPALAAVESGASSRRLQPTSADLRHLAATAGDANASHRCTDSPRAVDRDDLPCGQRTRCDGGCPAPRSRVITASSSPGLMWVMCTSTLPSSCASSLAERGRAQVAADAGELALLVAERGLDHQVRDAHAAQALPQRRVGPGVAGEDPGAARRPPAPARQSRPPARCARPAAPRCAVPPSVEHLADRERHRSASTGCSALGRRVKSGQMTPLKMCARSAARVGGQRVHLDRRAAAARAAHHAVGQQADGQHMVEVRVAEQDVVDARQLVERQVADAGAGVDQHVVVEQERGGAAAGGDGARTAEDADLHEWRWRGGVGARLAMPAQRPCAARACATVSRRMVRRSAGCAQVACTRRRGDAARLAGGVTCVTPQRGASLSSG